MTVADPMERDRDTENQPPARVNKMVFYGSATGVVLVAVWAIISPQEAADAIGTLVGWTSNWFGWYYILLATAVLAFVIFLGASRYGKVRLGPEHSRPEYSTFSWAAMLFAAGIGTDLMFFSVAEPVTQYLAPPNAKGGTVEAAREATVWTLFHYGISGWGMYALMGMALGYFSYRMNLPLSIRSALYPIFGKRVQGGIGNAVDLAAVLGTIFGIATSLGIGVVQLNYGLQVLMGVPQGTAAQIGLVAVAVLMATASAVSGVDKGIKVLSQMNVLLAIGLAGFILVTGRTTFLLNAFVNDIGDYVRSFPGLTMQTFPYDHPTDWLNAWTLFFWAWWIAWASFVGLFLARISRGRTIREFVVGTIIIPFTYVLMWVSIFGNSAIDIVRSGDQHFGKIAMNLPQQGFYTLLAHYPAFGLIASVATFVGLLFYVTSADSGALVMGNLCSTLRTPQDDANPSVRIFWAVATGLLTVAMLIVGGVPALQNATIIMGLPFAFVMVLVMVGLYKALRLEVVRAEDRGQILPGALSGRGAPVDRQGSHRGWRRRLAGAVSSPDRTRAVEYVEEVALPALQEVAQELREAGVDAGARRVPLDGRSYVDLTADLDGTGSFEYQIRPHEVPVPASGDEPPEPADDVYWRLEVRTAEGDQGYDVMGYSYSQLIDDVLDQYRRHLESARVHGAMTGG